MFEIVAQNLIGLCALIAIGFAAGKLGIIDERLSKGLGEVLLKIALPCTIIMSMQKPFSRELLTGGLLTLGLSVVIYIASLFIGLLVCKLLRVKPPQSNVWLFAAMFPNVGYMGFPVLGAVFGDDALFYVSMNNAAFNALSSTVGIAIMGGGVAALLVRGNKHKNKDKPKKERKPIRDWNILPAFTALGFVLFILSAEIPAPLANGLRMAGNMTTPLSMLIIGALLGKSEKLFQAGKEWALIGLRLIILPLAVFAALAAWVKDPYIPGALVLLTGMPVSAVTAIYASQLTDQGVFASRVVAVSTVLSLVTLPCVALLL